MLPIQRKISAYNFYSGNKVKYIVIHDVGTVSSAKNNVDYFSGGNRNASAHYFVDDNSIWQSVEDHNGAWHVGDGYGKYGIDNQNSIGIEMCLKAPLTVTDKTVANTIELTKYLMQKHNVPIERVVRHYDASRKVCPGSFKGNNWAKWSDFKKRLSGASVTAPSKPTPTAKKVTVAKHATHYSKSSKGEAISSWVKGQSFEVKQERPITQSYSNREYLLVNKGTEIGWVLSQDIVGGYGSDKVGKTTTGNTAPKYAREYNENGTMYATEANWVKRTPTKAAPIIEWQSVGQGIKYHKVVWSDGIVWLQFNYGGGGQAFVAYADANGTGFGRKYGYCK